MVNEKNKASPGISTGEAMEIAEAKGFSISRPTMIKWAKDYKIGKKVFGRWYIDESKLLWFLKYGQD